VEAVQIPFNMRHRIWPIRYTLPDDGSVQPAEVRKGLVNALAAAIGQILRNVPARSEPEFEATPSTYDRAVFSGPQEPMATLPGRISEYDQKFFVPEQGPRMFLRLLPTAPTEQLSVRQARDLALHGGLKPLALAHIIGSEWCSRNRYGAIIYRKASKESQIEDLTQLFKNRELWGITFGLSRGNRVVPYLRGDNFELGFLNALKHYMGFARETLGLTLPLRLIVGITGVEGYSIYCPGNFDNTWGRAMDSEIILETKVDGWDIAPAEALNPFFEEVWENFDLRRQDFVSP
jgi:hypothetical protein